MYLLYINSINIQKGKDKGKKTCVYHKSPLCLPFHHRAIISMNDYITNIHFLYLKNKYN